MNKSIINIKEITGYKTSKNYKRLWNELSKQSIVCICDFGKYGSRDIARTRFVNNEAQISARGICYISEYSQAKFMTQCKERELEWIIPNKEKCKG